MGKRQSGVMGERIQEIMHQARREYRRIWRFRWKAPDLSVCLGTNQAQRGKNSLLFSVLYPALAKGAEHSRSRRVLINEWKSEVK